MDGYVNNDSNVSKGNNNTTNTFNLVIGIATLLIALLGATFAYFSATARSDENDVTVKSAYVSIYYDGGTEIKASNLIPATEQVVFAKYRKEQVAYDGDSFLEDYDQYNSEYLDRKCVDARGKEVCYVYQFSVESDGAENEDTDILAYINVNKNEFENLSYILYEVTFDEDVNGEVIKDKYGFGVVNSYNVVSTFSLGGNYENLEDFKYAKFENPYNEFDDNGAISGTVKPVACLFGFNEGVDKDGNPYEIDNSKRCIEYPIKNKVKHTYQLVIWLGETGDVQEEQGLVFEGTVVIEVSGGVSTDEYADMGGNITGVE